MLRTSAALLLGWLSSVAIAAEPPRFSEPLNVEIERTKIVQTFVDAVRLIKDQNDPAYQTAVAAQDDSLGRLAAAAEAAQSTEHEALAKVYFKLKRYDDAARKARSAVEANAADRSPHFLLVSSLCQAKHLDEATAEFSRLTSIDVALPDAKIFLRDAPQPAFLLVNSLTDAGKLIEAEHVLKAWRAQLDKLQLLVDTQPDLAGDMTLANGAAAQLAARIRTPRPVSPPSPSTGDGMDRGERLRTTDADSQDLAALRAAQQKRPPGAIQAPSTEALQAARAAQRATPTADPAADLSKVRSLGRAGPADHADSKSVPPSAALLEAQRAAQAKPLPVRPGQVPASSADTLPSAGAQPGAGATPAGATQASSSDGGESAAGANTLTPKERALAAARAAQSKIKTANSLKLETAGATQQVDSFVAAPRRAAESIANRLVAINAKYLQDLPIFNESDEPLNSAELSEDERRLRKQERVEQWRRSPRHQQAEAERTAALANLAAEAEAAKSTEHAALAEIYRLLNRPEDAIRAAQTALNEKPADKIIRALLIRLLVGLERRDDAVRRWREGLEQNPADPEAQVMLLRIHCEEKRIDDALAAYRSWLDLDVAAANVEGFLQPTQHTGVVPVFLDLLCAAGRFTEAQRALDDLSAKIAALEKLSPEPQATASARSAVGGYQQFVAKAQSDRSGPSK